MLLKFMYYLKLAKTSSVKLGECFLLRFNIDKNKGEFLWKGIELKNFDSNKERLKEHLFGNREIFPKISCYRQS